MLSTDTGQVTLIYCLYTVQSLSRVWLFVTPWTAVHQVSLSFTISRSLFELISIESSDAIQLSRPRLLLTSIIPSIRVFSSDSVLCIRWPKYWSFSFSISPSDEYSGLISFRMDWLDLLTVQGTLNSLFQHHSSKASILQRSAFTMVQLSHPYMTTGKIIAVIIWIFVGKVVSLLFNILSRFVIAFLPRSKRLQWCLTLCYTIDCRPPSFSVHEVLQAKILEWVAISSSRGSSQHRDRTQVS